MKDPSGKLDESVKGSIEKDGPYRLQSPTISSTRSLKNTHGTFLSWWGMGSLGLVTCLGLGLNLNWFETWAQVMLIDYYYTFLGIVFLD